MQRKLTWFSLESSFSVEWLGFFKYLSVTTDEKRNWKLYLRSLFHKLAHHRIVHLLDKGTRFGYFNGLVLPYLDYADTMWGDHPGLKAEMGQLQAFENRFAKKIERENKNSLQLKHNVDKPQDAVVIKAFCSVVIWSRMQ